MGERGRSRKRDLSTRIPSPNSLIYHFSAVKWKDIELSAAGRVVLLDSDQSPVGTWLSSWLGPAARMSRSRERLQS